MLTKAELAAISERAERATLGEWEHRGDPGFVLLSINVIAECSRKRDGLFIAHARTDVPALLAHIEELERDRSRLEDNEDALTDNFIGFEKRIAELEAKLQRALDYARCAEACEDYEGPVRWRWIDMVELMEGNGDAPTA